MVVPVRDRDLIEKTQPKVWWKLFHTTCFAEVRINDYLVGLGPPLLTIAMWYFPFMAYEIDSREAIRDKVRRLERRQIETATDFEGGEFVFFLGPHLNASVEAWRQKNYLHVTRLDGEIRIVSPAKDDFPQTPDNLRHLDFGPDEFRARIAVAARARLFRTGGRTGEDVRLPMLVTDANKLRSYYKATGSVYDGSEEEPVLPPAPPLRRPSDPSPSRWSAPEAIYQGIWTRCSNSHQPSHFP